MKMLNSKGYAVFALLLSVSCFCKIMVSEAESELFVSSSHGNDSSPNCSANSPCRTLDRVLHLASAFNLTKIFVARGNYSLNASHHFEKMSAFSLYGNGSSREDVQVTCDVNVSISFNLSNNITFECLKFVKCGGWHKSIVRAKTENTILKDARFKTALDFRYCRSVRISEVEISESPGLGANLNDVGGVVEFSNVLFADNYARDDNYGAGISFSEKDFVPSGGGVSIKLNQYDNNTVYVTHREHDSYQHNNSYVFTKCQFIRNKAPWVHATKDNYRHAQYPFNLGGGLAVNFTGNASSCTIKIKSCYFFGNEALRGGGLGLVMQDSAQENSLEMHDTWFQKNHATFGGGGVTFFNLPTRNKYLRLNRFRAKNCTFVENRAMWGGGTSIYGTTILRKVAHAKMHPSVVLSYFIRCRWLRNIGIIGAAVETFLQNDNTDFVGSEVPFHVWFENDTLFHANKVIPRSEGGLTIGQGSVYSVETPLVFRGNAIFTNNSQSALVLDGSTIELRDRLDFINNTGLRGGAMAMYGRSRIVFHKDSTLNFEGNTCDDKGGALYIQAPGSPLAHVNATLANVHTCFFGYFPHPLADYDDWDVTVVFKDNSATTGKSVYATTLKDCGQTNEKKPKGNILNWKFVKFVNNSTSEVATDPVNMSYHKKDWIVAPGEVFNAKIELRDEIGNLVSGIVDVTIAGSFVNLSNPSKLFLATNGKIRQLSLSGKEKSHFSVGLHFIGSQVLRTRIENLTLKECYPGFIHSSKTQQCECMNKTSELGKGVSHCDPDGKTLFVKKGYWAGFVPNKPRRDKFATYFCPIGYCSSTGVYKYRKGHVCRSGRNQTTVLCGECKKNYTISFGSEQCVFPCPPWHLLFLVLIAVIVGVLVILTMLIDLDVFTGYLNAWLYSYQVMELLTPDEFQFDPFMEFFIGLSNLRIQLFRHSFCLAEGLDDADKLVIMYALPTFVMLVVWVLTQLVTRYPDWCFSRRVRAPHRAICTIFVLCYTNITTISLKILDPAKFGSHTVVLFQNGKLPFFEGKHLVYGILAIIYIIVFVVPFPMILLFRPFLTTGLRPVLNLNRWMPYLDAFQGCLKNHYRWCASFYFIGRLGILLIYTYLPHGSVKQLVTQSVCILILVVFASLRPYIEARDVRQGERSYGWINVSDVVVLTTLSLISVLSAPIDSSYPASSSEKQCLRIVVKVLAYGPLLVAIALGYRFLSNRCPRINFNCCIPPEDDELLPSMSETSEAPQSSSRGTPSIPDEYNTRHSWGSQVEHRSKGSQQSKRGSQEGSRGSQEGSRGGRLV